MLCLTLDNLGKKKLLFIEKKKLLLIATVIRFPAAVTLPSATSQPVTAAPQLVTTVDPPPRRPAHQSTDPRRVATSDTDQRQPPD